MNAGLTCRRTPSRWRRENPTADGWGAGSSGASRIEEPGLPARGGPAGGGGSTSAITADLPKVGALKAGGEAAGVRRCGGR